MLQVIGKAINTNQDVKFTKMLIFLLLSHLATFFILYIKIIVLYRNEREFLSLPSPLPFSSCLIGIDRHRVETKIYRVYLFRNRR